MTEDRFGMKKTTQVLRARTAVLASLLLSVCFIATAGWGQGATGTVVGTVTDSSGAVIPNAPVSVTNTKTNVTMQTKTTSAGEYTAPYLNPSVYRVTVELPGFKKAEVNNIPLGVAQTVRADIVLKPGATSQTVTVSSAAVTLDTDSQAIGQVISQRQILDLPMDNRSILGLMTLSAGSMNTNTFYNADVGPSDSISIDGARGDSNLALIDGMTNTEPFFTTQIINLSLDAIQEFKQQESSYSAQYGDSASVFNLLTKSGTNDLHGTAFEFLRNNAFDALNYFSPPNAKTPPLHQNDYGYSLGGPVYIPKVYNGRNHTFFFANFERLTSSNSAIIYSNAPTPNDLQGVISSTTPILNPATGLPFATDVNGNYLIPATDWERLALVSTKTPGAYFPIAGSTIVNGANSVTVVQDPSFSNQQTYRIDQRFGSKDTLNARVTLTNQSSTVNAAQTYGAQINYDQNQSWNVIENHMFNDHLINQMRVGWLGYHSDQVGSAAPAADIAALGLQNTFPTAGLAFSNIDVVGFSGGGGVGGVPYGPNITIWNGEDSLTWVHGGHDLVLGLLVRPTYNTLYGVGGFLLGQFFFDGTATAPAGAAPTAGNAWADFLLGQVVGGNDSLPTAYAESQKTPLALYMDQDRISGYANDDWKVNRKLTVNLGLRYDYQGAPTEENHRSFWLDHSQPGLLRICTPDHNFVASGLGGAIFESCKRDAPKTPFAPRVGFEYSPFASNTTVIRGGWGIFFDQYMLYEFGSGNSFPYVGNANLTHTNFNSLFPAPTQAVVTGATLGNLYNIEPPTLKNPYLEDRSLSIEQELQQNTKLTVAYVGSLGLHLEGRATTSQPYSYNAADPASEYPYQNYGTFGQNGTPFAPGFVLEGGFPMSSNYNSLQISLDRRTKNLALLASYTWSSSMDDGSSPGGEAGNDNLGNGWAGPMDSHNYHLDYAKSSFDVNKRLVASFVYQLPFGRGQDFGSGISRAADAVVGGWQVNGIYTIQSGLPFNNNCSDLGFVLQSYDMRCDRVGNPYPSGFKKSIKEWFNTAAYAQQPLGVYASEHRNDLRAPIEDNLDFSLFKNFSFPERLKFQLRAESFNALNHPQFNTPNPNLTSPSFGAITSTTFPGRIIQLGGKIIF